MIYILAIFIVIIFWSNYRWFQQNMRTGTNTQPEFNPEPPTSSPMDNQLELPLESAQELAA